MGAKPLIGGCLSINGRQIPAALFMNITSVRVQRENLNGFLTPNGPNLTTFLHDKY
jgi:hypothetical protein